MAKVVQGLADLDWQAGLRQAALNAPTRSNRRFWLAALALGAMLAFTVMLIVLPGSGALSSSGLNDVRQSFEQTQRLASGNLTSEGLYPLAYPLWLLVVSRFTNDFAVAARVLSGLSAVLVLFLAYQLCHSLADTERASEQSCFALLALALSPSFFLIAAGGGTDMPYLALLLAGLLCVERALGGAAFTTMAIAGLLVGLSLLIRPISVAVPIAVGLWLWRCRPFGDEGRLANLRPGLAFMAAFMVGTAPQLLLNVAQRTSLLAWGLADLVTIFARLWANPLTFLAGSVWTLLQYLAGDDIERLSAVAGSWQVGEWGSLPAAIIALAPTILKLLGLVGLALLCWLERFEATIERARLPATLMALFVLGGAFGLVNERSLLAVEVMLFIFAFAGLPSLLPSDLSGLVGLGLVAMLLFHQIGVGYPAHLAPAYRASDQVATELALNGALPSQVMSANWALHDTRSPWKERYLHVPIYVDSVEGLIREMRRQGATYLLFDRQVGADQWPHLAGLMETERPREGLRALHAPLRTDESPPNAVAIYRLE